MRFALASVSSERLRLLPRRSAWTLLEGDSAPTASQTRHHTSCDTDDGPGVLGEIGPSARAGLNGACKRDCRGEALTELVVQLASHLLTLVVANFDQTAGQRESLGRHPSKPLGEFIDGAPDQRKLARAKRRQTPSANWRRPPTIAAAGASV